MIWIEVSGRRLEIVERDPYDYWGKPQVPAWDRALTLCEIMNERGFSARGPFNGEESKARIR